MTAIKPQIGTRNGVLRLKQLLDQLRATVRSHIPTDATTTQAARFFGVDWSVMRRFLDEGGPGGPVLVHAVHGKVPLPQKICDDIVNLLRELPDTYKTLVKYPEGAINLVFDVRESFIQARSQNGRTDREQITGEQFSRFFGDDREFILALTTANRQILEDYSLELDMRVRSILQRTDWSTVRPLSGAVSRPVSPKATELRRLVDSIQPRFPSEWAMLRAIGTHKDSFKNAIAGKGRPEVLDKVLRNLRSYATSNQITRPAAEKTPTTPEVRTEDPHTAIGGFISHLNSFVRMGELIGINPDAFTDGHRDQVLKAMGKLLTLAKIDETVIARLLKKEGMATNDPALRQVLKALSGAKR